MVTVALTIKKVPSEVNLGYGSSYLNSILNLVDLNIGESIVPNFAVFLDYPMIGGSYIGELFYNFHWFGLAFSPIIGILISIVSSKIENIKLSNKYYELGYYLPFMITSLWWIRDGIQYVVRNSLVGFIYYLIILYSVRKLSHYIKHN